MIPVGDLIVAAAVTVVVLAVTGARAFARNRREP
jgi:hypothetical protein